MEIRNITDQTQEIAVLGNEVTVEPGATVEVPDDVALGEPPRGKPTDLDFYPGSTGLVGTGKFEATKRKQKDASASASTPSGGEG